MKKCVLIVWLGVILLATGGYAQAGLLAPDLEFDTELVSMNLTGGPFPLPLATDPTNALGDSVDGYGFVDSQVAITLSSSRPSPGPASPGKVFAFRDGGPAPLHDGAIDPAELDGDLFFVDSFFDVFFDITVTDVDDRPGRNINPFAAPDATGDVLTLQDNGPTAMQSFYQTTFDKDAFNFGLFPPAEADPWIGGFNIEIPFGVDINGNGINDKMKLTLLTVSAGDGNRTFSQLSGGFVMNEFGAAALAQGAVVDETSDPPFTIGAQLPNGLPDPAAFGGPTTATSKLLTPITPEPMTIMLLALGGVGIVRRKR